MKKLTKKRVDWIINQIVEWYRLREQNEIPGNPIFSGNPTRADVDHSSLLRRLLGGEKIFEYAPPRSYSYPDYRLASGQEVVVQEVWFGKKSDNPIENMAVGKVIINQAAWKILRKENDARSFEQSYIIQWEDDPAEWILRPRTQQEFDDDIKNRRYASILNDKDYEISMQEIFLKHNRWTLQRLPYNDEKIS